LSKIPDRRECLRLLKESGCSDEVIGHCEAVTKLAVKIAGMCGADKKLVTAGALLHDIGRSRTHGIAHAVEGAKIARRLKLPSSIVNIIERHIGAGLTKKDAAAAGLPPKDYIPLTLEEKIVAHADNLIATHSKQTAAELAAKWKKNNLTEGIERLLALHRELSELCGMDLDEIEF
jgi:tRNA (cytidine56-2'-O)-methyltransferase